MVLELPTTQEAVIIEQIGGAGVLQHRTDHPIPTLKEGEILIKNEFVGVNYIDTFVSLDNSYFQSTNLF
jgi:NADPH:quinone reductase